MSRTQLPSNRCAPRRRRLGLSSRPSRRDAGGIDTAFATLARERPDAVLLTSDPVHHSHLRKIIYLTFRHGLPGCSRPGTTPRPAA